MIILTDTSILWISTCMRICVRERMTSEYLHVCVCACASNTRLYSYFSFTKYKHNTNKIRIRRNNTLFPYAQQSFVYQFNFALVYWGLFIYQSMYYSESQAIVFNHYQFILNSEAWHFMWKKCWRRFFMWKKCFFMWKKCWRIFSKIIEKCPRNVFS